jgi:hypothetical protein
VDLQRAPFLRINGVHVRNLNRLIWLLREKYPRVLEADRRFEEETGFRNKVGANNLVDALSHIGTLFESAPGVSANEQRDQITLFEDHLRRSMMEAWEQMLDFQLGEIDKLWEDQYLQLARPLQVSGDLAGSPSHLEIDRLRRQYKHRLHEGRSLKRGPGWDQWEQGTDLLIQACAIASELRERVEESIAAAKKHGADAAERVEAANRHQQSMRRDSGSKVLAVVALLVAIAAGLGLGALIGIGDKTARTAPTATTGPPSTTPTPAPSTGPATP